MTRVPPKGHLHQFDMYHVYPKTSDSHAWANKVKLWSESTGCLQTRRMFLEI